MNKFTLNPITLFYRIITGVTTETDGASFLAWMTILTCVAIVFLIL